MLNLMADYAFCFNMFTVNFQLQKRRKYDFINHNIYEIVKVIDFLKGVFNSFYFMHFGAVSQLESSEFNFVLSWIRTRAYCFAGFPYQQLLECFIIITSQLMIILEKCLIGVGQDEIGSTHPLFNGIDSYGSLNM